MVASACIATAAAGGTAAASTAGANATLSWGTAQALVAPPGEEPRRVEARMFGRTSLLYETDDGVRRILGGSAAMQQLPWIFRVEPSTSGPGARLGSGNDQRMVKVSGAVLAARPTAAAMAEMLRDAINRTCTTPAGVSTCTAHRVAVDEIDSRFGGPGGRRSAAGMRLREAMVSLSRQQSRWGGSYASRVHFVLAPGPATSVAAGYGTNRSLGRNGLPIRRNYRDAFAAMALGAGVWIQMYHYSRSAGITSFTAAEWRDVPTGVASFLRAVRSARNPLTYLHVVLTTTPATPSCTVLPWVHRTRFPAYGRPLVAARAREDSFIQRRAAALLTTVDPGTPQVIRQPQPSPMACQWDRAQASAANARILMNGPAAYRLEGDQATTWGVLFRQFFLVPPN